MGVQRKKRRVEGKCFMFLSRLCCLQLGSSEEKQEQKATHPILPLSLSLTPYQTRGKENMNFFKALLWKTFERSRSRVIIMSKSAFQETAEAAAATVYSPLYTFSPPPPQLPPTHHTTIGFLFFVTLLLETKKTTATSVCRLLYIELP